MFTTPSMFGSTPQQDMAVKCLELALMYSRELSCWALWKSGCKHTNANAPVRCSSYCVSNASTSDSDDDSHAVVALVLYLCSDQMEGCRFHLAL